MDIYFSTFITGFDEVIKENLPLKTENLKIIKLLDGLVIYKTNSSVQEIRKIRFFNNSYLLMKSFEKSSLEEALLAVLENKKLLGNIKIELKKLGKTFRIIFSDENQIVAVNKIKTKDLEELLSNGIKLDKANPDIELWFLRRSEDDTFVGVRITKPEDIEKHLRKGELKPELAHLLCLLSEPSGNDVLLDPFAGFGAIVLERTRYFPFKKVMAGEENKQVFKKLQQRILENKMDIVLGRWDATNLSSLTDNSINKIITDPPWGFYKINEDLEKFYTRMLQEFSRVMKSGGLGIILMGQKETFEKSLKEISNFKLIDKLDILVSGKKASVYKIRKN